MHISQLSCRDGVNWSNSYKGFLSQGIRNYALTFVMHCLLRWCWTKKRWEKFRYPVPSWYMLEMQRWCTRNWCTTVIKIFLLMKKPVWQWTGDRNRSLTEDTSTSGEDSVRMTFDLCIQSIHRLSHLLYVRFTSQTALMATNFLVPNWLQENCRGCSLPASTFLPRPFLCAQRCFHINGLPHHRKRMNQGHITVITSLPVLQLSLL